MWQMVNWPNQPNWPTAWARPSLAALSIPGPPPRDAADLDDLHDGVSPGETCPSTTPGFKGD